MEILINHETVDIMYSGPLEREIELYDDEYDDTDGLSSNFEPDTALTPAQNKKLVIDDVRSLDPRVKRKLGEEEEPMYKNKKFALDLSQAWRDNGKFIGVVGDWVHKEKVEHIVQKAVEIAKENLMNEMTKKLQETGKGIPGGNLLQENKFQKLLSRYATVIEHH